MLDCIDAGHRDRADLTVAVLRPGRLGGDALFPGGSRLGVQPQGADAWLVPFQIAPEQPAERIGELVQGGVVDGRLAFPQVVHQQVTDRPAGDLVPVDQLLAPEPALGSQSPHRRRVAGEHSQGAEQLVEVRASRAGAAVQVIGDAQQLQAVTNGDVADQAALGGQDDGDPAAGQLSGKGVDGLVLTRRVQGSEPGGISGAGQPSDKVPGRDGGQQPGRARADHITADQHQHRAAEHERGIGGVAGALPCRGQPCARQLPPCRVPVLVGPAGYPPVLPGRTRMLLQPAQDVTKPASAIPLQVGTTAAGERGRPQPLDHLLPGLRGRRPAGGRRPWREPAQ